MVSELEITTEYLMDASPELEDIKNEVHIRIVTIVTSKTEMTSLNVRFMYNENGISLIIIT